MKRFEVTITGNKSFIVTQEQKAEIDRLIKEKSDDLVTVGTLTFRLSAIRSILEIDDTPTQHNKEKWVEENREWHKLCQMMSVLPIEEKVAREIKFRVKPGLKIEKIELDLKLKREMKEAMITFFKENPIYPRCPVRIWWPFIRETIMSHENPSKWWEIVLRNDYEIKEWVKYQ